jgi:hypothetical protein
MNTSPLGATATPTSLPSCWFCEREARATCECGRAHCGRHEFEGHCFVCALGLGLFEQADEPEPVSDLIIYSLVAASKDAYIVVPPGMAGETPLPMAGVERVLGAMMRMVKSGEGPVRHRAALVLANTTNTWPSMDPSQLTKHNYGTGLLAADQVRAWVLRSLRLLRTVATETTAVAILDKLRTADLRDLYPGIAENLVTLKVSSLGTRVHDIFNGLDKIYPTNSYSINERCELFVYEQYINKQRGAGTMMERMYGPRLRYAPVLAKMLKKGVWHSSYERFNAWFPGEDEPY